MLLQQKVILEHHPKNYPLQGTCGVLGLKMCPFVYRHVLKKRKLELVMRKISKVMKKEPKSVLYAFSDPEKVNIITQNTT